MKTGVERSPNEEENGGVPTVPEAAAMPTGDPISVEIPGKLPEEGDLFFASLGRISWRLLINNNPFYCVSAVLVLWGLRRLYEVSALDTWVLVGSLSAYALILALTCILVIRLGRIWEDGRSLLLLLPIVFLAMGVAVDDLVLEAPAEAGRMLVTGLISSFLISELVLLLTRIHLRPVYRISYLAILTIFFLYPLYLFPALEAQDGELMPVFVRLCLFPVVSCVPFLILLVDMFRKSRSKCNGTPWQWPWFPFTLFALLAVALGGRTYFMAISFFPIQGDGNPFGVYQLLPLTTVVALLAIEIGVRSRRMQLIWVGLALPVLTAVVSVVDLTGSGVNVEYAANIAEIAASPLFLASVSTVIVGAYAFWRQVNAGESLVLMGLVALVFVACRQVPSLSAPQALPCLALALASTGFAYWRPGSWRVFVAGQSWTGLLCLIFHGTFFVGMHGILPVHAALGISLLAAGIWNDPFARFLRTCNSVALFAAGCVAFIGGHEIVESAPWVAWFLYPLLLVILCGIYSLCTWTAETLASGCLIGIGLVVRTCISAFLALSCISIPGGAEIVALGSFALFLAMGISTLKGVLRIRPDCREFVADLGKELIPALTRILGRSVRVLGYAFIGGLFLMLCVPICNSRPRERARRINCAGNLKSIGLALRMYSSDNDGWFPPSLQTLQETDYLVTGKVYHCPSMDHDYTPQKKDNFLSDYWYIPGHRDDEDNTATIPLAGDRGGNHTKFGNICFADGHVKGYASSLWYQQAGLEHLPGENATDSPKAVTKKGPRT